MKTLIMCSGGYKSAFITSLAAKEGTDNCLLFIDKQKPSSGHQLKAVQDLAGYYHMPYHVIKQTGNIDGMFRVTTLVFSALSYANKMGYTKVYYGTCSPNKGEPFSYEHTHTHLRNLQMMMKAARHEARLVTLAEPEAPCLLLKPRQVYKLGRIYNVPWELAWYCECGGDRPCGKCRGCIEWAMVSAPPIKIRMAQ